MKSLNTWLVSSVGFCMFVAASPVSADSTSDTFTLMKKGKVVETLTFTEAQEGTDGVTMDFKKRFPLGTQFDAANVVGDSGKFLLTPDKKKLILQVFSDGDTGGGTDTGESASLSIVGKNGKPSSVADTLVIKSDAAAVPEPGTIGLLCAGLIGLWLKTRAKRG